MSHLARILELKEAEAAALAAQQAGLLLVPPQVLRTRLEALAAVMKVGGPAPRAGRRAPRAARRMPHAGSRMPRAAKRCAPRRAPCASPPPRTLLPQADVEDARLAAVKRPALLLAPPAALRRAANEAGAP